jgi:hypothetical protein
MSEEPPVTDEIMNKLKWQDAKQLFFQRLPSFLRPEGFSQQEIERIVKATRTAFNTVYP